VKKNNCPPRSRQSVTICERPSCRSRLVARQERPRWRDRHPSPTLLDRVATLCRRFPKQSPPTIQALPLVYEKSLGPQRTVDWTDATEIKVATIAWPGGHLAKRRLPYWRFNLANHLATGNPGPDVTGDRGRWHRPECRASQIKEFGNSSHHAPTLRRNGAACFCSETVPEQGVAPNRDGALTVSSHRKRTREMR
jgi:hypothetical protein